MTDSAELTHLAGFGGHHASEALEGALPHDQNNPKRPPHGLYAEQVNGTSFTVPRAHNKRVWLYRIRPSTLTTPWRPLAHATFEAPAGPVLQGEDLVNLIGWKPRPIPSEVNLDFLDGLATYGGGGDAALRRGFAVHVYVANRDMGRRAFSNADSEMVILPDTGRLRVRTELGVLEVGPGQLLVMPRALVFAVDLLDGPSRGYVGEAYARSFELPERGVVGANALSDARHFEAPTARFDEDDSPHTVVTKTGGRLFEAERAGTPFDVVAWHGNLAPYRYDLKHFCPVGAVRFDHPDPSIFTVLSAPLDQPGENTLDLVVFPERWEVTEKTFRPPYFHRNAATEINAILTGPTRDQVFSRGGLFVTPPHTPHGVSEATLERARGEDDAPTRLGRTSRWMQFETTFPMRTAPWAHVADHRDPDFGEAVRSLPVYFDREPGA